MKKQILMLFIAGSLLASACVSKAPPEAAGSEVFDPTDPPASQPTETTGVPAPIPTDTEIPPTPMDAGDPTPEAAKAARRELAELLGIGENEITINSIEETVWPDACLGAASPSKMCAMVETPGFVVTMTAAGMTYIYHTDRDGSSVRSASTVPIPFQPVDGEEDAAAAAVRFLAGELNIPEEEISVAGIVETQWPDACLGLPEQDEMCALVVTPGFLVQLQAAGQTCFVHMDREGSNARYLCGSESSPADERLAIDAALLFLSQELGIPPSDMAVTDIEAVDWPDACLGISRRGIECLTVITPGYRIMIEAGGEQYEVRTNRTGSKADMEG